MEPDDGDRTIGAYEAGMEHYLNGQHGTAEAVVAWIDAFAALLPAGGRVLEIGSGPGTDADLLEDRGLRVLRSDATRSFADRLRAAGHEVLDLDVRRDPLPAPVDGVFANAVLLHLDRSECAAALSRIRGALAPGGALACTLKEGDGERWTTARLGLPRRFTFWRQEALHAAVQEAGFAVLSVRRNRGERDDWLQVLARAVPAGAPSG